MVNSPSEFPLIPRSSELLGELRRHYGAPRYEAVLTTASAAWDARDGQDELPGDDQAELGECWRVAMLAATRLNEADPPPLRLVWRVRAMSSFVRSGCRNGAAMLCLPCFFEAAKDPRTEPAEALAILDAMLELTDDQERPLRRSSVEASCHEKRGYLLVRLAMAEADGATRATHLAAAAAAYQSALDIESDQRRQLKIRAGANSVVYLQADRLDRLPAISALLALREELVSEELAGDVLLVADVNLDRMRDGRTDLLSYELT